ncbi:NAD(P)H-dependent oxidoreductase [Stenotrophomonas sp. GD03908]|uniref:NAD(P)H-dependent oxidoreductase n=1 Tax=Stenotrophomonas maltophilia TaxID=40324 RepID=A0AAJ2WLD0_STEMA|nr:MULTISPECIES: NAD(P)H-dependent oxidoreductase [Stenotrophomonas]MBH1484320.1 NAD(P)H-dependent oxidoreductase [Stenotrophomonas maltophilia]MCU1063456.1 NAD(P)H-dependent oxidoreductase [Stenotrophomonas maltophilia]MDH0981682.1 NAD(P)H-dependent oxidoreductase [Stenotrophomonas sp. GD03908]MDQ7295747.1 NAD(P)H-dependent oxidoreductase [Stenotrophomonas sp. Sm0041]MDZ5765043.1 NAD(P)H-dependent oxidoreductase [Stenotrophomonas maltophilia]
MRSLIVTAHPEPGSLTHAIARRIGEAIAASDAGNTVAHADLMAEGFDPRFTAQDQALFRGTGVVPADVAAEHARLDATDTLVLVYPLYWWSFPALLKGWIDRVFTQGWAYQDGADGKVQKKLQRLRVHLVGVGGAGAEMIERRGYGAAMKTQIDMGIFDYCGARMLSSQLLLDADSGAAQAHLQTAVEIGRKIGTPMD